MWNNPRLLNAVAGFLTSLALVALGSAALVVVAQASSCSRAAMSLGISFLGAPAGGPCGGCWRVVREVAGSPTGLLP